MITSFALVFLVGAPEAPDFMRYKPTLPEAMLRTKEDGAYVTVLPAIGFDVDTGFNYGAFVELYENGEREDPFFSRSPYRSKVFIGAVAGTNGFAQGRLGLDAPNVFRSRFRIRGDLRGEYLGQANYFGVGEDAMRALTFPGDEGTFRNYRAFKDALKRDFGGTTYAQYDRYRETSLRANLSVEMDTLGGLLRPLVGVQFARYWVSDFTGESVNARGTSGDTVEAMQLATKLREDCDSGQIIGCDGGSDHVLRLGLTFDTRDFEPDPDFGLLLQAVGAFSAKAFGSSFNYARLTPSLSAYVNLLPGLARVIFASRVLYNMSWGDVPFYAQDTYGFTVEDRFGLGGFQTMRGFRNNRFIGKAGVLTNLELRFRLFEAEVFAQSLGFSLVPFLDLGRVFDRVTDFSLKGIRAAYGGGLKLAWNLSTIISFDLGFSEESNVFIMELGQQF